MATKRPRRARVVEPRPLASLSITALVPAIAFYAVTSPTRDHGVLVRMAAFIALQLSVLLTLLR